MRIFISSPSDVAGERHAARCVVERLATWFQGRADLRAVLWEDAQARATAPFQDEIVQHARLEEIDVVVVVLWGRLGSPLGPKYADGGRVRTGTEWEFETAVERFHRTGSPQVLVYRRVPPPDPPSLDAPPAVRATAQREFDAVEAFFRLRFQDPETGLATGSFHTYNTPAAFEARVERHLREIVEQRLARSSASEAFWAASPFRSLAAFDVDDHPIFFGRAQATSEAIRRLQAQVAHGTGFLLVLGASGAGKSSLARAGIAAHVATPAVVEPSVGNGFVRRAVLRPGDGADALDALSVALLAPTALGEVTDEPWRRESLAAALRAGPAAAIDFVRERLARAARAQPADEAGRPPAGRLVLVVDQMEELFTIDTATNEERRAFGQVVHALALTGLVWVVGTLRADFYARLAEIPEIDELRRDGAGQLDLRTPSPAEVTDMIRLPARAAGLAYGAEPGTGRGLDEALIEEAVAHPGSLPLVQFALEQLYERRQGSVLSWATYREIGGVAGALARHAESAFGALDPEAQASLPLLVRAVVDVGETGEGMGARKRAPADRLAGDRACARLIEALVRARLLERDRDGAGRAVVSVTHEALIRAWPRFAQVLDAQRDVMRIRERVAGEAAHWARSERHPSLLIPEGLALRDAQILDAARFADLDDVTRDYVRESIAAEQERGRQRSRARRRRRIRRYGAVALILVAVPLTLLALRLTRDASVRRLLLEADGHLAAGQIDEALGSVARAEDRDPRSAAAVQKRRAVEATRREQQRQAALAEAATALLQAQRRAVALADLRRKRDDLWSKSESLTFRSRTEWLPPALREEAAALERELGEARIAVERVEQDVRHWLEHAQQAEARAGGVSEATRAAFAEYFLGLWRESVEGGDELRASLWRNQVERVEPTRHREEFEGLGGLRIVPRTAGATVHLFRYESYETVRPARQDPRAPPRIPRLVPVPTRGREPVSSTVGDERLRQEPEERAWWGAGSDPFYPGDPCLLVTAVASGSIASSADLRPGDLVIRAGGWPVGDGLFVAEVTPGGPAAQAGVRVLDRILGLRHAAEFGPEEGPTHPVQSLYDWEHPPPEDTEVPWWSLWVIFATAEGDRVTVLAPAGSAELARQDTRTMLSMSLGLRPIGPADLVQHPPPSPRSLDLVLLRGGQRIELRIPAGESSGITCEQTAYPLILSMANQVEVEQELRVRPGSYVLLARAAGCEDLRYPIVVPRRGTVTADFSLLPAGTSPPGFAYVPPGAWVFGGDVGPVERTAMPPVPTGFHIARTEVTFREWLEFLNDPDIARDARQEGAMRYVPRDGAHEPKPYVVEEEGRFVLREDTGGRFPPDRRLDSPLLGVTYRDVEAYVRWRNARRDALTATFIVDLPTAEEWEHAARGADGRFHPWGNRFDFELTVGLYRRPTEWPREVHALPAGSEPLDESPFGVRDLGGSRWEWIRGAEGETLRWLRGGAASDTSPYEFRSTSTMDYDPDTVYSASGFRLVARPRP